LREADSGHTLWVDEGLASQEGKHTISIRPARAGDVRKSNNSTADAFRRRDQLHVHLTQFRKRGLVLGRGAR